MKSLLNLKAGDTFNHGGLEIEITIKKVECNHVEFTEYHIATGKTSSKKFAIDYFEATVKEWDRARIIEDQTRPDTQEFIQDVIEKKEATALQHTNKALEHLIAAKIELGLICQDPVLNDLIGDRIQEIRSQIASSITTDHGESGLTALIAFLAKP